MEGDSFPIPEFDNIGMEVLPFKSLINADISSSPSSNFIGYVPRYIDFKTDYDRCVGGFASVKTQSLQSWIIPYSDNTLKNVFGALFVPSENPNAAGQSFSYPFMKVDPRIVDPMFAQSADETIETDQLLNQCYVDCKVVRNLDVNGLPY